MGKLSQSVYIFILNEFYVYTGLKYKNFKQFGNNLGVWREPLYHFREPKEPKFILKIVIFGTVKWGVKGLRGVKGHFLKKFFNVLKWMKYQLAKVLLFFHGRVL